MVDNVAITAGTGTSIATDDIGGVHYQRVKMTWGPDGTANDNDVATGKVMPVHLRTNLGVLMHVLEDQASADGDPGFVAMARRTAAPANTSGTDLDYESLQMLGGRLFVRGEPRGFAVVGGTLTRPANTTAYTANDAVSNNGTAGSVTAQTATLADTNDDPIMLTRIRLASTDTGFGGKNVRMYVFNSDPTASTGVGGGDNAAWSQKQAGLIATFSGIMRAYSDGCVGLLTPDEGFAAIANPVSGAKTLYTLLQTLDAATPSANSTTFIATIEGVQLRA